MLIQAFQEPGSLIKSRVGKEQYMLLEKKYSIASCHIAERFKK